MTIRKRAQPVDVFNDRFASFTDAVRERNARSSELLGPTTKLTHDPAAVQMALDELRLEHEELLVAEEELRAQLAELNRMGARVEAERERYAQMFEHAPDAYLVTDRSGVIHEGNAAAADLLGIERRYLRGKPLSALLEPPWIRVLNRELEQQDTAEPRRIELVIKHRHSASVAVTARVSASSRGERLLWCLRIDERVASSGDGIARVLRDKDELLERERRARKELERANRTKDRFIAVLAHDLRAPLNAILGWTQLVRRETMAPDARDHALATIERNARRQAHLIDELLDISRMTADKVQLALAPTDAGVLLTLAVDSAQPKATELGVTLNAEVEPDLGVVVDRDRIGQVLSNLIANALQFTPRGGRIDLVARNEGNQVEIRIQDTGVGIDAATLPRIFEMYTQDRDAATSRDGLGLGLFIVKQLVELHHGSVHATSDGKDKGATFTIRLPRVRSAVELPSDRGIVTPSLLRDLRILVVDDDEDARELLAVILQSAGASVSCARGSEEALRLFGSVVPDVVVSDLSMPDGDGSTLLAKLRRGDRHLAAVAISGFTTGRHVEEALEAGFDVHIGKPVEASELVQAVDEAARMHRAPG